MREAMAIKLCNDVYTMLITTKFSRAERSYRPRWSDSPITLKDSGMYLIFRNFKASCLERSQSKSQLREGLIQGFKMTSFFTFTSGTFHS